jgi:hypothetical protein
VVLERFESRYLELHDEADRLLQKPAPSQADLKYLQTYLPNNPVTRFYFFGALSHPGWLQPLADAGFFREPPEAVRDEQKGTIAFPQWPVLRFLAKLSLRTFWSFAREFSSQAARGGYGRATLIPDTVLPV